MREEKSDCERERERIEAFLERKKKLKSWREHEAVRKMKKKKQLVAVEEK